MDKVVPELFREILGVLDNNPGVNNKLVIQALVLVLLSLGKSKDEKIFEEVTLIAKFVFDTQFELLRSELFKKEET